MMEGEQGPASIIPKYVAQRRKQACSRCHTKRIKCLGGVPCRNCIISASPCTFPPPTKRARTASASFTPLLPVIADNRNSAAGRGTDTTIAPPTPGNYRRTEKVFASSKSSHDARGERPNYAGSPSCLHFVKKFNDWLSSLRETLAKSQNYFFDTTWLEDDTIGPQAGAHSLEITISTTSDTQASAHQSMKPSSIRLPPYNYSIHLIQVLEDSVAHEQHLFRRKELRAKVWQMHQTPDSPQSKDQGWLCHWLSVAALGELHNALPAMRTDTETPGSYYYHQSVALLPQVAENPDVQYIATLSMLCLYAFSLNRLHTAYMYAGISLRAALALKLHRDPSEQQIGISNLPELELEHRKRLFWTVYYQDLLTTCTTASPWGVLDDEITVGYPSPSASQSGDFLLEFADSECLNQHLELMRLRSQGYSSLYGYAGTAINPFSHICLMDHELGQPLTSQHLDKSLEFYDSLVSWETELPPAHRVHKGWDGAMLNLNRINATLYLIYYQSILVLLRPALVMFFNDVFEKRTMSPTSPCPSHTPLQGGPHKYHQQIILHSMEAAVNSAAIIGWLSQQGALPSYSYFHAHYLFTAAIALLMCTTMSSHPTTDPTTRDEASTYGPDEQHAALKVALSLLGDQAAAGNAPAREFKKEIDVLQQNLQALEQLLLQQRPEAGEHVFDLLVE